MQKQVVVYAASGTTPGTATLYIQEGYYLQSVQCKNVAPCPGYVWLEYFYDRNEDTFGEILTTFWVRNATDYAYTPAIVVNKEFETELSSCVFHVLNQSATDNTYVFVVTYGKLPSYQLSHYHVEEHRGIWAYDDMIERHTDAGALEVDYIPAAGSWFELDTMFITAGITSALITISIQDSAGEVIKTLSTITTATGTWEIPILATSEEDNTASTPSSIGKTQDKLRIHYPDRLNITTASISAAEDLLIRMRGKLKDVIPTITYTGNTQHQAAYTDNYSQVI